MQLPNNHDDQLTSLLITHIPMNHTIPLCLILPYVTYPNKLHTVVSKCTSINNTPGTPAAIDCINLLSGSSMEHQSVLQWCQCPQYHNSQLTLMQVIEWFMQANLPSTDCLHDHRHCPRPAHNWLYYHQPPAAPFPIHLTNLTPISQKPTNFNATHPTCQHDTTCLIDKLPRCRSSIHATEALPTKSIPQCTMHHPMYDGSNTVSPPINPNIHNGHYLNFFWTMTAATLKTWQPCPKSHQTVWWTCTVYHQPVCHWPIYNSIPNSQPAFLPKMQWHTDSLVCQ